jgi:NADH:ubiquinone oxidoreductase subunit 6 (subunit J)
MLETLVTYGFAALVVIGGLMAALNRQILYAIIGMAISLFGLAGLFLYLGSPFVAAMQVLIYIGGISVAIVFAMMLSIALSVRPRERHPGKFGFALLCAVGFFAVAGWILYGAEFRIVEQSPDAAWGVDALGHALLNAYNLVFEALSVVLLLAIIGSILIARKEKAIQ